VRGSRLSEIQQSAFEGAGVTALVFPASLHDIGERAFPYCGALASIVFADRGEAESRTLNIGASAFLATNITDLVFPQLSLTLGDFTFAKCEELRSVVFHPLLSLAEIPDHSFEGTAMSESTILNTVRTIGHSAFDLYGRLSVVRFGDHPSLQIVGRRAFAATSLVEFACPASVLALGEEAFSSAMSSFASVALPRRLQELSRRIFAEGSPSSGQCRCDR
jgi:hypothetical protein